MKKKSLFLSLLTFICFLLFTFSVYGQTQPQNNEPLPQIKTLEFIAVPSSLERIYKTKTCQENLINSLKNYNKRLKNINGYEVYLIKQSCEFSQSVCLCFEEAAQGEFDFLFLYKRETGKAKVIIASYSFLSDSEVYMMNYEIKDNVIMLTTSDVTEGEGGKAEEFSKNKILVSLSKNGEVKVLTGKE
jgi:hypothetical protein